MPRQGVELYIYTLFWTSGVGGDGWSTSRPGRFTSGNHPVLTVQETGWTQGQSEGVRKIYFTEYGDKEMETNWNEAHCHIYSDNTIVSHQRAEIKDREWALHW